MTDTDPRIFALKDLAAFCKGFVPSRVTGSPRQDAHDIVGDLHLIVRKVDSLIEAYGAYCRMHDLVSDRDLYLFQNQLEMALDDNATFVILRSAEQSIEA